MKKEKMLAFLVSHRRDVSILSLAFIPVFIALVFIGSKLIAQASFGTWGDTSLINACLGPRGQVTIISAGSSCQANETQATWLKDIDVGSGLTLTRSSSGATISLSNTNNDGWTSVSETWTYASASTFTISGVDDTTMYHKGTRLKLTQSSTVKYFVVIDSSYSGGNTTVTLYGGTDYSLANSAISSQGYSYESAPQGYPQWFNDTNITFVADTGSTISSPTYNRRVVSVIGNQVFIHFNGQFTIGGSATPNVFLNVPIAIVDAYDGDAFGSDYSNDANGSIAGAVINSNTSTQVILRKYTFAQNWATSGTVKVGTYFTYEY